MSVNKIILFLAVLFLTSICDKEEASFNIGEAINKLSGCVSSSMNCPDTIYISNGQIDIENFDMSSMYSCLSEVNSININDFKPSDHIPKVELKDIKNSNAYYYELNSNWRPPRTNSRERVYFTYSKPFVNDSKMIIYVAKYLSGKDIGVNACLFDLRNNEFVLDDCYCRWNPF